MTAVVKENIVQMAEDRDSFTVIYGFMTQVLHLSGAELVAYAKVYGFTRQGKCFFGSLKYLSEVIGASRMTASRALAGLEEKGLIARIENRTSDSAVRVYIADLKKLAFLLEENSYQGKNDMDMTDSCAGNEVFEGNRDYVSVNVEDEQNEHEDAQNVTHRENSTKNLKNSSVREDFKNPSLDEIKSYCDKQGLAVDIDRFYERYESQGWISGGKPVLDWKKLLHGWVRNASKFAGPFGRKEKRIYVTPLAEKKDDADSPYKALRDINSITDEEADRILREFEAESA